MKKKTIIILIILILLAAAGVAVYMYVQNAMGAMGSTARATEVRRGELVLSVAATGTVQSENSRSVYSSLAFTVDTIFVEEGQYVREGEVLAKLDTESLEIDIRQQIVTLETTELNTDLDINSRRLSYQDARARSALTLENALRSYELLAAQVEGGTYPELINAQTAVDNAKDALDNAERDLETKEKAYDDNIFLYELGETSRQAMDNSHIAYEASRQSYDTALRSYELAVSNQQNLITRLNDEVETSRRNYQSSKLASEQEVQNARRVYDNAVAASSNEAAKINLERLEKQLNDATITAPISGIVTKIYAVEGSPGSGLLFIIDDLDALEIATRVKEFDVNGVQPGMSVIIRSDATGERDIPGEVKFISPASERTSAGASMPSSVVEYETIVSVSEPDSGLRIGMNTRMSIVLDSREDVLYVPYDAVLENPDGSFGIYVADELISANRTSHRTRLIPVNTGLETDFAVEIWGEGIFEGLLIISNPLSVTNGAEVVIN